LTLAENSSPALPRITLIDTLRGIALVAMASYHFTWDLEFFGYLEPGTATQGWWKIYARAIASSFLFLAGVSLVLAHVPAIRWRSFWKRFSYVAGAAAAISVATFFAVPNDWIFFGILHAIAAASLIGLAFIRLPVFVSGATAALVVGLMVFDTYVAPGTIRSALFNPIWLAWTGLAEMPPRSNDFVPLFPWLAALLAGISLSRVAMDRQWLIPLSRIQTRSNLLSKAGRHSLLIYLIHQPVLIAIVYLFSLVSPAPQQDPRQSYMQSCEAGCVGGGNDAALCQSFCGCTMEALAAQSLLEQMQAGSIDPQTDERVLTVAQECAIQSQ
jgi:uncharacterized membrane protein